MAKTRSQSVALPAPNMKVNAYDKVSSWLLAVCVALLVVAVTLGSIWLINRPPRVDIVVPVEMLDMSGGEPDGDLSEMLQVELPEPAVDDASLEEDVDPRELENLQESMVDLSSNSAQVVQTQISSSTRSSGKRGSAAGTSGAPLGEGGGDGSISRDQRWLIKFNESSSLDEYASQLDFFGIEVGVLTTDQKLIYLSQLKGPVKKRVESTGKNEKRLYMTWQGATGRTSDLKLLQRAGINATQIAGLLHFYPPQVENQLAQLEFEYAKRQPNTIRRTYFVVEPASGGYRFVVTRQTWLN